jgi:Beta-ketoacyl synthase, N-terminal domain
MSTLSNGTNSVYGDRGAGKAAATPIAIVGMACRFPGNVTSPSQLWELCASGKDGWQPIPESRFDVKSLYHKNSSRAGRVSWQDMIESSSCNLNRLIVILEPCRRRLFPGRGCRLVRCCLLQSGCRRCQRKSGLITVLICGTES